MGSAERTRQDEDEIQRLVHRYAMALDRRDLADLSRCFTDDGEFVVSAEARLDGSEATDVTYGPGWAAIRPLVETTASSFKIGTHFVGQTSIQVDGDAAQAETYGLSFAVPLAGQNLLFRGVRYLDDLSRVQGDWRIRRRRLTLDWSTQMDVTFSQRFDNRVDRTHAC